MAKGKGENVDLKRFWVRCTKETRKALQHAAIDLDTTVEVLAGYILTDAIDRSKGDTESLRRVLPRSK